MTGPTWHEFKAKKEAVRRVNSRCDGFTRSETLQKRRAEEAKAAQGITRLVRWFADRGFEAVFGRNFRDEIFYDLKRVKICSRPSLQSQLIGLLHEAGHLLLFRDEKAYTERFGRGWPKAKSGNARVLKSAVHRVQLFEEELEAWNRGRSLASRLRLTVNPHLWTKWRYTCLAHYAGYTAKTWNIPSKMAR
jgi:hypothetical protein